MKYYLKLDGEEISAADLSRAHWNLEDCGPDGGSFEAIVLDSVQIVGDDCILEFSTCGLSTF